MYTADQLFMAQIFSIALYPTPFLSITDANTPLKGCCYVKTHYLVFIGY